MAYCLVTLSDIFSSQMVRQYAPQGCIVNALVAECPYEGQVFMDCAPLCHTTCSNVDQNSPCSAVCVRGCGCPQGMVIDEDQRRCVMPSQCPNKSMLTNYSYMKHLQA